MSDNHEDNLYFENYANFSSSCLIDERGSFMLTGGYDDGKVVGTVSRYDINGFIEDLQPLNNPRYDHGCTQYLDSNIGALVRII